PAGGAGTRAALESARFNRENAGRDRRRNSRSRNERETFAPRNRNALAARPKYFRRLPQRARAKCRGAQERLVHDWRHRPVRREIGRHTSELQSQSNLVCRLLLEKK